LHTQNLANDSALGGRGDAPIAITHIKEEHTLSQQHYSRRLGERSSRQAALHSANVIVSPILALIFGGGGTILGFGTNVWQIWTSEVSFMIMITAKGGWLDFLPVATSTGDASFNHGAVSVGISWLLAIAVQFGVAFFSLRVDREFLENLHQAQGERKGQRVKEATKKTFVAIAHNRDFFFYYGVVCFALDGLGDYQFCITLTGNIVFLAVYGLILMATSTLILAIAAEWLWAGIKAFLNAWAEAHENARRAGRSQAAAGGGN
jgi:hypothetical protein